MTDALVKINISDEDIVSAVVPFFNKIEELHTSASKAMRRFEKNRSKDSKHIPSDALMNIMKRFFEMQPFLLMMESALSRIEKSNNDERMASEPIEGYKSIINGFLEDSRKSLVFTNNSVQVSLPSGDLSEITALSSGERQLFVLITHLVFNRQMRGANILLIDEPELSLHLKWQRQFVPSIRKASPDTQMILATHSPEIVFNRTDRLIPLS
ncbi:ATP-binding protein [Methylobacterium sp. WL30]|nr:ATP-binding protein [Methylobacterium sp. WL30]